ncbi:MAG: nucleotide-binding protein [Candidatus Humimicrobiaceae bacterium]
MSLSIAALIQGFRDFDKCVDIKGVIINNIGSQGHYQLLKEIINKKTGLNVIGYLPSMPECSLPDRHLGLVTSSEIDGLKEKLEALKNRGVGNES